MHIIASQPFHGKMKGAFTWPSLHNIASNVN